MIGLRRATLAIVSLSAACLAENVDVDGAASSDLTASDLADKQLRASARSAPFRSIAFERKGAALVYRAERSATGLVERGTATLAGGRLVLTRDNVTEVYAVTESGARVTLTPAGGTDHDDYVKEATPPDAPPPPPLLTSGGGALVRLENGRTFVLRKVVAPSSPHLDMIVGEELDAQTGEWKALPNSPATSFPGTIDLVTTPDGRIVVVGSPWVKALGGLLELDTKTGTWSAQAPVRRTGFGVGVCPDGSVLAIGGDAGDGLQPYLPPYPEPLGSVTHTTGVPTGRLGDRVDPVVVSTKEGILYILGGALAANDPSTGRTTNDAVAWATAYDCARNEYRSLPDMSMPRRYHAATVAADGRILVFGGKKNHQDDDFSPSAEAFDPRTSTWSKLPDIPLPSNGGRALLGPKGVVWYGGGASWIYDAFDPKTGLWTSGLAFAEGR